MCNKNCNHMRYCSWYTEWDGHNFLTFWIIYSPFTPLTTWKIKIWKKWKKHLETASFYRCVPKILKKFGKNEKKHPEISVFYTCVPKMMIIWCFVSEIWSERDIIFCHFGNFFALYPPNNPDQNFEDM